MKVTLQVISSSGGSYPVEFSDEMGSLRVFCHCQAGAMQQICKHKIALLKGDLKMLFDPAQEPLLRQVLSSAAFPALKARLEEYEKCIADIEREIAKVKEKEKALKRAFAHELTYGRPALNTAPLHYEQPSKRT